MPSPWSRRAKLLIGGAVTMAVLGASAGVYFGIFRKQIERVTVEVTRTEEPPAVAEQLYLAERAAQAQHYVEPAEGSALLHLERAEQEAERLGVSSPGAGTLRRAYASALAMVGDHLLRAGLSELAVAKFKEALLFDGGNPELQRRAELSPRERQEYAERARRPAGERAAPRTSSEDRATRLAANVFMAARDGRTSEARSALKGLAQVDRGGVHAARIADALRATARTAWTDGRADEARALYGIMVELDRSDPEARERARSSTPAPTRNPESGGKPRKDGSDADEAPRNPTLSRTAADVAISALNRGDLDQADAAFRRALRADPLSPTAVGGLAEVAFERARYTEALDLGRRAWKLAPRSPRYLTIIGDSYFKLLRFDDARTAYERALALAPRDDLLHSRMERVKARLSDAR
jgi:tetratricopeptide (TPR) repeat protein